MVWTVKTVERLLLAIHAELYIVPSVRALILELLRVDPGYLAAVATVHQRREEIVITIAAYTASFMSVHLELVTDTMARTAHLPYMGHLGDVDWFL